MSILVNTGKRKRNEPEFIYAPPLGTSSSSHPRKRNVPESTYALHGGISSSTRKEYPENVLQNLASTATGHRCSICDGTNVLKKCTEPSCPNEICYLRENTKPGCVDLAVQHMDDFVCPHCCIKKKLPLKYSVFVSSERFAVRRNGRFTPFLTQGLCVTNGEHAQLWPYGIVQMRRVMEITYTHPKIAQLACIEVTTTGVAGVKAKAVQNAAQRANTTADNALSAFMDNIEQDPNVLVMFEGHGDNVTGRVVHNDVKGNQDMLFVSEVLQTYVNKLLWERLPALNSHKGLLLLTCGAAITAQHSRDNIIELVRSRRFSFAIAFARTSHHNFSGYEAALASVMSRQVRPQTQVWPHIHQPFLGMAQLRASPVVFVFRDRPDDEQITVRMLYSVENSFWGWLDPVRCGDMRCSGYLSATTLGGGWVSAKCSTCGSSSKIPAPEFVYDMKGGTATVPYPHPTNIPWHVKKHWKKK